MRLARARDNMAYSIWTVVHPNRPIGDQETTLMWFTCHTVLVRDNFVIHLMRTRRTHDHFQFIERRHERIENQKYSSFHPEAFWCFSFLFHWFRRVFVILIFRRKSDKMWYLVCAWIRCRMHHIAFNHNSRKFSASACRIQWLRHDFVASRLSSTRPNENTFLAANISNIFGNLLFDTLCSTRICYNTI